MTHELRIERLIDAPVEVVYDTFNDPDKQAEIQGEGQPGWVIHRAETDVRVGGTSTSAMGAEGKEPDTEIRRFTVVEPPHRLVFTHRMILPSEDLSIETEMTITFEDRDGFTEGWREMLATLDRVTREGLKARHDSEGIEMTDETRT